MDRTLLAAPLAVLVVALAACGGSAKGPPMWEACRASSAAKARIDADLAQGVSFGVPATPTFVINGNSSIGLPSAPDSLESRVALAIEAARADAQANLIGQAEYYATAIIGAGRGDMPVPVGGAPVRGPADAWVTLVEWSDFECPFCRAAEPQVEQVLTQHPADVRLVYKQLPLTEIHERALPAALAADCAGQQGKFWEMHDLLMQGDLSDDALADYARTLGLQ
ncbi:MAG TPA: thioredoxin domain-containing protein [Anaeromyxobacteraceae bacterium]|nr:thioredoxin domain-containing protein [Anaeromyxobacteraceae bacterium]